MAKYDARAYDLGHKGMTEGRGRVIKCPKLHDFINEWFLKGNQIDLRHVSSL